MQLKPRPLRAPPQRLLVTESHYLLYPSAKPFSSTAYTSNVLDSRLMADYYLARAAERAVFVFGVC